MLRALALATCTAMLISTVTCTSSSLAAEVKRNSREDPAQLGVNRSAAGKYAVVGLDNPVFRRNSIFSEPEDLSSPRFKGLRERYNLDEVVEGQADEFGRIIALRHWLHEHVVVDKSRPAVDGDALKMLEESPNGGAYHCAHFMKMQNAVMNAMGHVTRNIFAAAGEKEKHLSGAHGINEVWVNSRCKWVVLDAELDSHFEKDGVPLSALEIRDEVLRDGARSVFRIRGPSRKRLPRERDDTWGHTPRTYTWVAWYPEANEHTIWPRKRSSYEFVYEDAYWQDHTWYRGGKEHWAYDAGYFKPVKGRDALYWTPNVISVKNRIEGDVAEVQITSCTPNLKEYQARQGSGEWKRVDKHLTLRLSREHEQWFLRSVNLAGVCGPEYRLVIERR